MFVGCCFYCNAVVDAVVVVLVAIGGRVVVSGVVGVVAVAVLVLSSALSVGC